MMTKPSHNTALTHPSLLALAPVLPTQALPMRQRQRAAPLHTAWLLNSVLPTQALTMR